MIDIKINPNIFYWASVSSGMKALLIVMSITLTIVTFCCAIYYFENRDFKDDADAQLAKKIAMVVGAIALLLATISTLLPTRLVLVQMMIAENADAKSVEGIEEILKSIADAAREIVGMVK